MYFWLIAAVVVVWAWLAGGSALAWREHRLGGFLTILSVLAWTGIAGLVVLFVGPYWQVLYAVFGQPG